MSEQLRVQHGGDGEPVLLLLHGLGATADVWNGLHDVLRRRWRGRWLTPDLPGHGGSRPLPGYSFGHLAAAVARAVPSPNRLLVLGHSLGGVVALGIVRRRIARLAAALLRRSGPTTLPRRRSGLTTTHHPNNHH